MGSRLKFASVPVELSGSEVPSEFRLLKQGANTYDDGDTINFDDAAAEETMRRYRARGIDLMADYEHQSLAKPPVIAPASAKRFTPVVRGGDLIASDIQWTDKAKQMLMAGEYRYYSIACKVDTKSNRCVQLLSFALTNNPAADGIEPLVAASLKVDDDDDQTPGESMKTIIVALGLNAETAESDAVATAARLKEFSAEACTLLKTKSTSDALKQLRELLESGEKVVQLTAELATERTKVRTVEFDALVKEGLAARKITPAQVKADGSVGELRSREDGVELLKKRLKDAPAVIEAGGGPREENAGGPPSVEITEQELTIAKNIVGNNPEELKKHLEQIKAYKAERAARVGK